LTIFDAFAVSSLGLVSHRRTLPHLFSGLFLGYDNVL